MAVPCTPTRSSKRFQPLVSPVKPKGPSISKTTCPNEPIYQRPTRPDTDLLEEEREKWDQDEGARDGIQTCFYDTFTRTAAAPAQKTSGKRGKKVTVANVERYAIGDTVFLRTVARQLSIGVITAIWVTRANPEDGSTNPKVMIHWFLRPNELPKIRVKRDHFENEIYYTLSRTAVLSTDSIVSHCTVSNTPPLPAVKKPTRWSIASHRSAAEDDEERTVDVFYCRFAVESRQGLFYEFSWPQHLSDCQGGAVDDATSWDVLVSDIGPSKAKLSNRSTSRKSAALMEQQDESVDSGEDSEEYEQADESDADEADDLLNCIDNAGSHGGASDDDNDVDEPVTPSRKRKRASASPKKARAPSSPSKRSASKLSTPRKPRASAPRGAQPTPHSKAALIQRRKKQKMNIRPSGLSYEGLANLDHLPKDPWLRAMHLLHVGSRPDALPCRDEEFNKILRSVNELLEEGSGGCIYISGVPGTGKTATVHAVVRELKRLAEDNETNPFSYVEINGLRISEPSAAYSLLWEAVLGHDVQQEGHLKISSKDSLKALTRHFSGGNARGPGGHACVVLMDELDQLMTTKQDVVYNFFNWPTLVGSKLVVLAVANTMDLPERVMTGRVRSRLGMTRINFQPYTGLQLAQIVQARLDSSRIGLKEDAEVSVIAPDAIKLAAMKVSGISGDARRVLDICRRTVELAHQRNRPARASDVNEVIRSMQNSPTAAYLRDCSFHERLMLASLVKCIKREGVEEIKWGEIQHQHLVYMNVLPSDADSRRKPTPYELSVVLDSLAASRAVLVEDGITVARKADSERRVVLNLEQGEVERVLSEVGGQVWKNVLS